MLVCPLCGKSSSLYHFDPRGFEDDIFVQNLQGLGRGRGFKVKNATSIFDLRYRSRRAETVLERLRDRTLEILQIMIDNDIIRGEEVMDQLGIRSRRSDLAADVVRFLSSIEELIYDQADEDSQQAAVELRRKAESQT
jgi:hypothetical protein